MSSEPLRVDVQRNRRKIQNRIPPTTKDSLENAIVLFPAQSDRIGEIIRIARERYDHRLAIIAAEVMAASNSIERHVRDAYEGRRQDD